MDSLTAASPTPEVRIDDRVEAIDWTDVSAHLDGHGWATIEKILSADECRFLAGLYGEDSRFRAHVVMARHGFGRGEYKYFSYPLPGIIAELRTVLYARLAPLANRWNQAMGLDVRYPRTRGTYRVHLRHGVSRVRSGRRHTVGVIFHDAK